MCVDKVNLLQVGRNRVEVNAQIRLGGDYLYNPVPDLDARRVDLLGQISLHVFNRLSVPVDVFKDLHATFKCFSLHYS
jgi:hypothetical protein